MYAKVITFNAGYDDEQIEMENTFKIGDVVPIKSIEVGQSHTSVYLLNFDGVFNSVFFDFYEDAECSKKINIYNDLRFSPNYLLINMF